MLTDSPQLKPCAAVVVTVTRLLGPAERTMLAILAVWEVIRLAALPVNSGTSSAGSTYKSAVITGPVLLILTMRVKLSVSVPGMSTLLPPFSSR